MKRDMAWFYELPQTVQEVEEAGSHKTDLPKV